MTETDILAILKVDLHLSSSMLDQTLTALIKQARSAITREGITLGNNVDDAMLIEQYAAYLYRQRRENTAMPRYLRWMLNNRLLQQKGEPQWTI